MSKDKLHDIILNKEKIKVTKKDIELANNIVSEKFPSKTGSKNMTMGILGEVMYAKKRNDLIKNNTISQPERGSELDINGVDFVMNGQNIDLKCPLIEDGKIRIFVRK